MLEIMKLRKCAWRKLYPYPEILEMEEQCSEFFKIAPFCIYFKIITFVSSTVLLILFKYEELRSFLGATDHLKI